MYFKENLRFLRRNNGVSQNELSDYLGYKSFTTVQKWEDGTATPSLEKIKKIAEYFSVTMDHIINRDLAQDAVEVTQVPVLGTVKGGFDFLAQQEVSGYEYVNSKEAQGGEYFYLDVVGDSMIQARILPGDRVYIRRQNTVENGQIAVVLLENNEVTLKKILFEKEGIVLVSCNDKYEDVHIRYEDMEKKGIQILGKLVHNKIMYS